MPPFTVYNTLKFTRHSMTLPEFTYPDQHHYGIPNYSERLAARILNDLEHDDLMDADDYDRRRAERDGWQTAHWDGH